MAYNVAFFGFFCILASLTVRMRINRSATKKRRSHPALTSAQLSKCADCGALHIPHRVCMACGKYKGRVVIDVVKAAEKKNAKTKEKAVAQTK